MAKGFRDLADNPEGAALGHAEWLGILLERESTLRQQKRFESRAKAAKLRHLAAVEDVDYRTPRGLDRAMFMKGRKKLWAAGMTLASSPVVQLTDVPMTQIDDLSRSPRVFDQATSLIVVVELSATSWLVAGLVPGIDRQPLKKLRPDPDTLLSLLERWRAEAMKTGQTIDRIIFAYEAGRDGFWLARWLQARGIQVHVIHSTSVAVSREHRRAKTDRLDTAMLMRVFLGWLRGERGHCGMVAVPTLEEEDAKRPSRERESLVGERTRIGNRMKSTLARLGIRGFKPELRRAPQRLATLRTPEGGAVPANTVDELRRDMARLAVVREQIEEIEKTRLERLEQAPQEASNAMVRLRASIIGVGVETADGTRGADAEPARPTGRGALRRPDRLTGRERVQQTREGSGQGRQCSGAPWADPTCLEVPHVPEEWRTCAVVSVSDRGGEGSTQDNHDCGAGPQAPDRAVAHGHDWRGAGGRGDAVSHWSGLTDKHSQFRQLVALCDRPPMTIRGGGDTRWAMALMPSEECARCPGALPPKRMVASWSGPQAGPTEYKVAAQGLRAMAGSPRFVCLLRNWIDPMECYPPAMWNVMRHVTS
jgi:transposase